MDYSLLFLLGLLMLVLACVSFVSAWAESRRPVAAIGFVMIAATLIGFVGYARPTGLYSAAEIPGLIAGVVAQLMRLF